jgi:hypothetical protein
VQVVGPVGHHHQQPGNRLLVAHQEVEQVPAGPVGPVRVLDDQQHRPLFGQPFQHAEHPLEQAHPGGPGVALRVGRQAGELPAQRRGERRVRQPLTAQLDTRSGQHLTVHCGRELPDQAGLADPRLAADQDRGRVLGRGVGERGGQHAEFRASSDEVPAHRAHAHLHPGSSPRR